MSELANELSKLKEGSLSKDKLGAIADLLERNNIAVDEIGKITKISLYQQGAKDADGEFMTQDLVGVQISPKWESGPEWPVIQQAEPTLIKPTKAPPKIKGSAFKCAVILPDPQIGYRRYEDGTLDPFHDEAAMSVAMQITAHLQREVGVDLVVNLGDFIDLPEHSKYVQEAAFAQTTQIAINRGHRFLAEQRATCPHAEIVLLEGNHDNRMNLYATNNAKASYGLRRAGDTPESWPVLSIPYLLRLDELDIEFRDKYPANEFWINRNLRAVHGDKVRSNGSTASAYANALPHISTIFGHIHRLEVQYKTVHNSEGPIRSANVSPGCLCRVDGAVPSTNSGVGSDGRPATRWENWQQGMAVVWYSDHSGGLFHIETIHIMDGLAIYNGKKFTAAQ